MENIKVSLKACKGCPHLTWDLSTNPSSWRCWVKEEPNTCRYTNYVKKTLEDSRKIVGRHREGD